MDQLSARMDKQFKDLRISGKEELSSSKFKTESEDDLGIDKSAKRPTERGGGEEEEQPRVKDIRRRRRGSGVLQRQQEATRRAKERKGGRKAAS